MSAKVACSGGEPPNIGSSAMLQDLLNAQPVEESNDIHPREDGSTRLYNEHVKKYELTDEEKNEKTEQEVTGMIEHFTQLTKVPMLLILPESKYMQRWDVITILALLFTAVVTPFEVALLKTELDGLFYLNRTIDAIFVKDMIMNFFLAYRDESKEGGRRLVKNFVKIRHNYFHGWFGVDFVSVVPFDLIGMVFRSATLQRLKVIRVIRLLRLLKLMRVVRSSRVFKRLESQISLSYSMQGLVKFSILLIATCHWLACAWVMQAELTHDEATEEAGCADDDENPTAGCEGWEGPSGMKVTWLDTLCPKIDSDGHYDPTLHCPYDEPLNKYSAALYWSIVTVTSVGYGDITPQNPSEMRMCTFLMLIGASIWAYIIGNACGIISTLDVDGIEHRQRMDLLNLMMEDQCFDRPLRLKLRSFFLQSKWMLKEDKYTGLVERMRRVNPDLEAECQAMKASWLNQVEYLRDAPRAFVVKLCAQMGSRLFVPQEIIPHTGQQLVVVLRGICSRMGSVMTPGKTWGEDFILIHPSLQDARSVLALTYVELLMLERSVFFSLLDDAPETAERVRRAVVRMTFRRAIFEVARALKNHNALALDNLLSGGLTSGQRQRRRSSFIAQLDVSGAVDGKAALAAHMSIVSGGADRASGDIPASPPRALAHMMIDEETPGAAQVGANSGCAAPARAAGAGGGKRDTGGEQAVELTTLTARVESLEESLHDRIRTVEGGLLCEFGRLTSQQAALERRLSQQATFEQGMMAKLDALLRLQTKQPPSSTSPATGSEPGRSPDDPVFEVMRASGAAGEEAQPSPPMTITVSDLEKL